MQRERERERWGWGAERNPKKANAPCPTVNAIL